MQYEFPTQISGDTFDGVRFTMGLNGSPLDLTSASMVMDVSSPRTHTFYTNESGSGLSIISGSSGIFEFDKQRINIEPGAWDYEIRFTLQDNSLRTYISGSWLLTEK